LTVNREIAWALMG